MSFADETKGTRSPARGRLSLWVKRVTDFNSFILCKTPLWSVYHYRHHHFTGEAGEGEGNELAQRVAELRRTTRCPGCQAKSVRVGVTRTLNP